MKINILLRAGCLVLGACAPVLAAFAQANPANPDAAVPATRYQDSSGYRSPAAPAASPDQNWKALNQTVGSINSMSLTMGGMDPEPAPGPAQHPPAGEQPQHQHAKPQQPPAHDHSQHGKAGQQSMPPGHAHIGHQHHEGMKK